MDAKRIIRLTSKSDDHKLIKNIKPDDAFILISTYTMMSFQGNRSDKSKPIFDIIENREWGLLLLDEV